MSVSKVPRRSVAHEVSALLDSTEIAELIRELDALRWTGRKGYGFVEQVLDAQGELESFRTFQKQPAQQRRTTEEHLRRFMGTHPQRPEDRIRAFARRCARSHPSASAA